ncbi:phage portal protein [Sulfurimonas sp.]|uniref:phage portal protein n=1 Tax=Sulfurimonas sp. TaxID=2022749 RepID=UPI0026296F68|nr:phage portal protein [Sulfurimonas sp.]MDD3452568.1 phage portal protein [Sulfurimonas sp.]
MHGKKLVVKSSTESRQRPLGEDSLNLNGRIVEPYLNYDVLRALYAYNTYHKRSIKLKALLLSQIEKTNMDKFLPFGMTPKRFLYKFMLNAETYGSAFFERAGTQSNFCLYHLNSYTARVDREHHIYQRSSTEHVSLEGGHFMYDTILSDFYGEPDYIEAINQIVTLYKADRYNTKFFDNGGKPDLAIIFEDSDPSDEQLEAITEYMRTNFKGYDNAHKTLILTTGQGNGENKPAIRIEEIGKVEDMSFEKLKKVGRDEIIAAHGVPPRLVGVVDPNALGGGGELVSQLHMFNQTSIQPKMELVEEFFAEHGIELELRPFDATAFKDDADLVSGLVQTGILTPAEAKNVLGWGK